MSPIVTVENLSSEAPVLVIWCKDVQSRCHSGVVGWVAGSGGIRFLMERLIQGKLEPIN